MLHRLVANKDSFQPIDFRPGMNVVLAERAEDAADTDSRNARGKTTLLLILNYILGGNLATQLKPLQGRDWTFSLTLDLFGSEVTVSRSLDAGSVLGVEHSPEVKTVLSAYVEEGTIRLDSWKELLGLAFFQLDGGEAQGRYGLSVRTLLSYVIRVEPGKDPLKVIPQQPAWSSRQHLAFMLGLDWHRVQTLQEIARKMDALSSLTTASSQGLLPALGNESELLLIRSEAQRRLDEHTARVDSFQVLDDPNGMVQRADDLTEQISRLRDDALVDQRMETLYLAAVQEARTEADDPLSRDIAFVYEQAGTLLGDAIQRRIDEVQAFHDQLADNRQAFLDSALEEIRSRSGEREASLTTLAAQRDQLMRALGAGGALDELFALRDELAEIAKGLAEADFRLQQVRDLAESRERLRADRATERQAAQEQLTSNRTKLDRVAQRFDARMQRLYGVSGVLTAVVDDGGYHFSIDVAGQSSTGVNKMKLFCLDLSLLEEGVATGHHPDFLVHDSSVFDGVDPRQISAALSLAHEAVISFGGQYICTLNSNDLNDDVKTAIWFSDSVVRTVLDTEAGGILGVAF